MQIFFFIFSILISDERTFCNVNFAGLSCYLQGHDTTAAAVSWAILQIGLHPDVQSRLHEEIDEVFGTWTLHHSLSFHTHYLLHSGTKSNARYESVVKFPAC